MRQARDFRRCVVPFGIFLLCLFIIHVEGFSSLTRIQPVSSSRIVARQSPRFGLTPLQAAAVGGRGPKGDDDDDDWNSPTQKEKQPRSSSNLSKMPGFVHKFLQREKGIDPDDPAKPPGAYTHLIAIPMKDCHELMVELEIVQRAVMYHCPALIYACIVQSLSRLPLLLVDARPTPPGVATNELSKMVKKVVMKHIYVKETQDDDDDIIGGSISGPNKDSIRPLTLKFQGLDVDGVNNEVLQTVVRPDRHQNLKRLQDMVQELQDLVRAEGWTCQLPPNHSQLDMKNQPSAPQDSTNSKDRKKTRLLPRLPFMRLPSDFKDHFEKLPNGQEEWLRTAEQGGDGISPVLWGKWADDVFGQHVRCREVAVYPKSSSQPSGEHLEENSFFMPHERVALPEGNDKLMEKEASHEKYNQDRYDETFKKMKDGKDDSPETFQYGGKQVNFDPNRAENKKIAEIVDEMEPLQYQAKKSTEAPKGSSPPCDFVEAVVDELDENDTHLLAKKKTTSLDRLDDWMKDRISRDDNADGAEAEAAECKKVLEKTEVPETPPGLVKQEGLISKMPPPSDPNKSGHLNDWTRERIKSIIQNRSSIKSQEPKKFKEGELPPLEKNPILNAYWASQPVSEQEARLRREAEQALASTKEQKKENLPPFPSHGHFVGIWESFELPFGLDVDMQRSMQKSDNLVLRADGSIMGGPVLETSTKQKAAGGSWKFVETNGSTILQIRLLVPPTKKRELVFEGIVAGKRVGLTEVPGHKVSDATTPKSYMDYSNVLEEKKVQYNDHITKPDPHKNRRAKEDEETLCCEGLAWMEDVNTGKNRKEMGSFIFKKRPMQKRKNYSIEVPFSGSIND